MKNIIRKFMALGLAAVTTLTMSSIAFAASGEGFYTIGSLSSDTTGSIQVKVVLESKVDYNTQSSVTQTYDVTVDPMADNVAGYSVRDAMLCLANNTSNNVVLYDVNNSAFDATDTYIKSMKINNVTYTPQLPFDGYALDGWMFRVNGKIPLISETGDPTSGGPYGNDIAGTPIVSGDVIHFHWDYQYQESSSTYYSTNYQSFTSSLYGNYLTVNLKKSWSYFDNNMYWHIQPYSTSSASDTYAFKIYSLGSNTIQKSGTVNINSNGVGTINVSGLSGTYYLHLIPQSATVHYKETFDYNVYDDCDILSNTSAIEKFTK